MKQPKSNPRLGFDEAQRHIPCYLFISADADWGSPLRPPFSKGLSISIINLYFQGCPVPLAYAGLQQINRGPTLSLSN